LLLAFKKIAKFQYPKRLHGDSTITPSIGASGIFENPFQNSHPFPELTLTKTRYFIMPFSNLNTLLFRKNVHLRFRDCITTTTTAMDQINRAHGKKTIKKCKKKQQRPSLAVTNLYS